MNNKVKLTKLLAAGAVMVIAAVMITAAWFYFTVRPDMEMGEFQAPEQGTLKVSAEEHGPDIGLNGEIELDVDGWENEMMFPGSSGSLTAWITSDNTDIKSFILTYTSADPTTDESVHERAVDISNRHILLFKNREEVSREPVNDADGNQVQDENGELVYDYVYEYSDPLLPVGEYTDEDPVPEYRIFDDLEFDVPYRVDIYWVWPYDYDEYVKIAGSDEFLFPTGTEPTEAPETEPAQTEEPESGEYELGKSEIYDDEDSYIGKVVEKMRFRFFVNGNRSIDELRNP